MSIVNRTGVMRDNSSLTEYAGLDNWAGLNLDGQKYQDTLTSRHELDPVGKLSLAILQDAIEVLKKGPDQKRTNGTADKFAYVQTKAWLTSGEEEHVFGFVRICERFNWNPGWVRRKIIEHVRLAQQEDKPSSYARRYKLRTQSNGQMRTYRTKRVGAAVA